MKKMSKILALIAAGAFLFGGLLTSCKDSDDDDDDPSVSITASKTSAATGETVTLTASASNFTPTSYTWENTDDDTITTSSNTVTSTSATTITVKVTASDGTTSVSATKAIAFTAASEYTNAYWNFKTIPSGWTENTFYTDKDLTDDAATSSTDSTKTVQGATLAIVENGETSLSAEKAGIKWKSESETAYGLYTNSAESVSTADLSKAAGLMELVIEHDSLVTLVVSGNGSAAAYRLVAVVNSSDETVGSKDSLAADDLKTLEVNSGAALAAGTYKIYVNGARIHSIKATSLETATPFAASTNNNTANDIATLGLVGTSAASSDTAVATVSIASSKIAVTSVAAGDATITVTDANSKTATIAVSVASSGAVTIGTITKYNRPAPTATVTTKATAADAADGVVTITTDGLAGDLEYSNDGATFAAAADAGLTVSTSGTTVTVSGLPAGTYYVRYAATDAYAASDSTSVSVTVAGGATTYTLDVSTASFTDVVVDSAATAQTTGSCTIDGLKFEISENKGKSLPDTQKSLSVINMAGTVKTNQNYVKFTTTGAAEVTVSFFNHSKADRHAQIITATDSTGQTGTEATDGSTATIVSTTFNLTSADTYYLGGDNGIYITKIVVKM